MKITFYRFLPALALGLAAAAPAWADSQTFTCTASQPIGSQPFPLTCVVTQQTPTPTPEPTPEPEPTPTPTPNPTGDPGRWTGLWIPPTLANGSANTGGPSNPVLVVADPSGALGVGNVTYVPGCINQIDPNRSTACKGAGFYGSGGTKVNLAVGRIVSIRYRSSASGAGGYYKIYNKDGGGVGYSVTTSLSTIPGDFNVAAKCQATGNRYLQVNFGVIKGVTYCTPFLPNEPYYVNIKVNSPACSGTSCNFKIVENSNLQ